jgi:hypothetical protein
MPLIRGSSDKTRGRNIATLRRDGYPPAQAAAIAYSIQRKASSKQQKKKRNMSRRLSRHRDRGLAYANPTSSSAIGGAIGYLGLGAAVGGGLGALGGAMAKPIDILGGAVGGGSVGVGATALGGFVVGLVSPANRNVGFATAGIGLASLILVNLATSIAANAGKPV